MLSLLRNSLTKKKKKSRGCATWHRHHVRSSPGRAWFRLARLIDTSCSWLSGRDAATSTVQDAAQRRAIWRLTATDKKSHGGGSHSSINAFNFEPGKPLLTTRKVAARLPGEREHCLFFFPRRSACLFFRAQRLLGACV